jgi:hypothetical protein
MPVPKWIVEGADHHVEHLGVAKPGAPALRREQVAAAAHGFRAAADRNRRLAKHDGLGRRDDRLQARPAKPVHRHRRGFYGDTRIHGGHPGEIGISGFGMDHIAHDHMLHFCGVHIRLAQSRPDCDFAQFGRCDVLQALAEIADRGALSGENEDFLHVGSLRR